MKRLKIDTRRMRVAFHDDGEWHQADAFSKGSAPARIIREVDWRKLMAVVRATDEVLTCCETEANQAAEDAAVDAQYEAMTALRAHLAKRRAAPQGVERT